MLYSCGVGLMTRILQMPNSMSKSFHLRFFGHLACSAPEEDHHHVIAAALRPPTDWRRPAGRLRTTWLRTIDEDVAVYTAWRRARVRDTWQQIINTAMLC